MWLRRSATPPPTPTPNPHPKTQIRFHFDVATYEGKFAIEKELSFDMAAIDEMFEFDFYGAERASTRKVSPGRGSGSGLANPNPDHRRLQP